jgi:hypothetical protein
MYARFLVSPVFLIGQVFTMYALASYLCESVDTCNPLSNASFDYLKIEKKSLWIKATVLINVVGSNDLAGLLVEAAIQSRGSSR